MRLEQALAINYAHAHVCEGEPLVQVKGDTIAHVIGQGFTAKTAEEVTTVAFELLTVPGTDEPLSRALVRGAAPAR